jgi:hypothetical protein
MVEVVGIANGKTLLALCGACGKGQTMLVEGDTEENTAKFELFRDGHYPNKCKEA